MLVNLLLPGRVFGEQARWPDGMLLVLTVSTTLASLTRQLPGQSVLAAALVICVFSAGAASLGRLTAIPFGPFSYGPGAGPELLPPLPWSVPLLWVVALLNSRGTAQVLLARWRHRPGHGYRLLGFSVLLTVVWDICLEPFATMVKNLWTWRPTRLPWDWYGAPVVNFLGWAVISLLIFSFITPFLLNKKKGGKTEPAYHPLGIWVTSSLLFIGGAVIHRLWGAAGFGLVAVLAVTALAISTRRLGAAAGRSTSS